MSIWGNLIGGYLGFSIAGPIGALIGSIIGGKISSARRARFQQGPAQHQQIFAVSLVILTAKLAKADGNVSKEELFSYDVVKCIVDKSDKIIICSRFFSPIKKIKDIKIQLPSKKLQFPN